MSNNTLLILGAGKSAQHLIEYAVSFYKDFSGELHIADRAINEQIAPEIRNLSYVKCFNLDVENEEVTSKIITQAYVVISMLPTHLHLKIAEMCVAHKKHLLTASYLTPSIQSLHQDFVKNDMLLMMECGLDPGIDHMMAMSMLDFVKSKGGDVTDFRSYTGAMLAPQSDMENPWEYKLTWNADKIIRAGHEGATFLEEGRIKHVPYFRLFDRKEVAFIPNYGYYEGYANRESLKYKELYQLHDVKTIYRGTLRPKGFCDAWSVLVRLGVTDDSFVMKNIDKMTHKSFINSFLYYHPTDSVELKLAYEMGIQKDGNDMNKLKWLGLLEDIEIGLQEGKPCEILQHIIEKKWKLNEEDVDMVVMWTSMQYKEPKDLSVKTVQSYFAKQGSKDFQTAISLTVGLPLGIVAKLLLQRKISLTGVRLPIHEEIYTPVLKELLSYGIDYSLIHNDENSPSK